MTPYWLQAMRSNPVALSRLAKSQDANDRIIFDKYFNSVIKQANRRLSNLEKNHLTQYAYDLARDDIKAYGGDEDNPRYQASLTGNRLENYRILMSARLFLSKKTSTVKGQKEVIKHRLATFRDKLHLEKNPFAKGYIKNSILEDFLRELSATPLRKTLSLQSKKVSNEIVELLQGKMEINGELSKEINDVFAYYMLSHNNPEIVGEEHRLYIDELMQYLRDGILPTKIDLRKIKKEYGLQ